MCRAPEPGSPELSSFPILEDILLQISSSQSPTCAPRRSEVHAQQHSTATKARRRLYHTGAADAVAHPSDEDRDLRRKKEVGEQLGQIRIQGLERCAMTGSNF